MAIHVDECLPMASIHENIIEANGGFPLPVHIEHPSRNHGGSRGLKPYSWDHTMQGVEHWWILGRWDYDCQKRRPKGIQWMGWMSGFLTRWLMNGGKKNLSQWSANDSVTATGQSLDSPFARLSFSDLRMLSFWVGPRTSQNQTMHCFQGKSTGKANFEWETLWFPVDFPFESRMSSVGFPYPRPLSHIHDGSRGGMWFPSSRRINAGFPSLWTGRRSFRCWGHDDQLAAESVGSLWEILQGVGFQRVWWHG